jgi:hypothetical protein
MSAILQIFLTRVLYMALLIVMLAIVDIGFPFAPKQNALITFLVIGVPMLAFALGAKPLEPRRRASSLLQFVLPAACSLALVGLAVYMGYLLQGAVANESWVDALNSHAVRPLAQTALTTVSVLCGLLLVVLVDPHGGSIGRWRDVSPRHIALATVLLAAFAVVCTNPQLRVLLSCNRCPRLTAFSSPSLRASGRSSCTGCGSGASSSGSCPLSVRRQALDIKQVIGQADVCG